MDKTIRNVVLFGAGYIAYLLMSANKSTMKANMVRVRLQNIDADWQRIRLTLLVQNPTVGNIVVRSIYGDLWINGDRVGIVEYQGYTVVSGNGSNYFTVTARYITQNMGRLIYSLFSGRQTFEIEFRGTANINNEAIPITVTKTWRNG